KRPLLRGGLELDGEVLRHRRQVRRLALRPVVILLQLHRDGRGHDVGDRRLLPTPLHVDVVSVPAAVGRRLLRLWRHLRVRSRPAPAAPPPAPPPPPARPRRPTLPASRRPLRAPAPAPPPPNPPAPRRSAAAAAPWVPYAPRPTASTSAPPTFLPAAAAGYP